MPQVFQQIHINTLLKSQSRSDDKHTDTFTVIRFKVSDCDEPRCSVRVMRTMASVTEKLLVSFKAVIGWCPFVKTQVFILNWTPSQKGLEDI